MDGPPAQLGSGFQEGTRPAKDKLERRIVQKDLAWEEAKAAAVNRQEWRWNVVQYVHGYESRPYKVNDYASCITDLSLLSDYNSVVNTTK